jgi:hypothetical protein
MSIRQLLRRFLSLAAGLFLAAILLGNGGQTPEDLADKARAFTRGKEFNFVRWTVNALGVKLNQMAVGSEKYLSAEQRREVVIRYLELVWDIQRTEGELNEIYADPKVVDPKASSSEVRQQLADLQAERQRIAPIAEAILQEQVNDVANQSGLTLGGQSVPPVLFHSSSLPWALIISPRETIEQEADISLVPELTVDQHAALEDQVDQKLDVSSLVVGIGGIGLYPTMVAQTYDLNWLSEVVAHEWVHNFLSLRPLGVSYLESPELRTMNETTASIAGKEIGRAVIEKYYPELLPQEETQVQAEAPEANEPPAFDYYAEMRQTRVTVDKLLAEGKVDEAEAYMEQRRLVFWENGYHLRKLNQAYFAFYGAYADHPGGGAAGKNPVGAAVQALRAQSASLSAFLNRISLMTSFDQLQRAVEGQ